MNMNTIDLYAEISRELPDCVPDRFLAGGVPLFTAFGCVLIERNAGRSFVYRALNLKTWRSVTLCRRAEPMTSMGAPAMADKIRTSPVAGPGRLQADRPTGESLPYEKLRAILNEVFRDVLPQHGYSVREQQIELAEHLLDAISHRQITLAEAEVGTGKTFAYLIAAILAKRGRMNDF